MKRVVLSALAFSMLAALAHRPRRTDRRAGRAAVELHQGRLAEADSPGCQEARHPEARLSEESHREAEQLAQRPAIFRLEAAPAGSRLRPLRPAPPGPRPGMDPRRQRLRAGRHPLRRHLRRACRTLKHPVLDLKEGGPQRPPFFSCALKHLPESTCLKYRNMRYFGGEAGYPSPTGCQGAAKASGGCREDPVEDRSICWRPKQPCQHGQGVARVDG